MRPNPGQCLFGRRCTVGAPSLSTRLNSFENFHTHTQKKTKKLSPKVEISLLAGLWSKHNCHSPLTVFKINVSARRRTAGVIKRKHKGFPLKMLCLFMHEPTLKFLLSFHPSDAAGGLAACGGARYLRLVPFADHVFPRLDDWAAWRD